MIDDTTLDGPAPLIGGRFRALRALGTGGQGQVLLVLDRTEAEATFGIVSSNYRAQLALQARLEAERITSRILEPFFSVLSPDEMATFGEVVETTRNAIDM